MSPGPSCARHGRGNVKYVANEGDIQDELPDDLNLQEALGGDYVFPNNNRRRVPGFLYVAIGALGVLAGLFLFDDGATLFNRGVVFGSIGLVVIGLFHLITGSDLSVDERDALVVATRAVGFPVGHASAQMGWRGFLSRPTWRILLYSNEDQPSKRGLVLVDGSDGELLDTIVEDNPEDWSEYA